LPRVARALVSDPFCAFRSVIALSLRGRPLSRIPFTACARVDRCRDTTPMPAVSPAAPRWMFGWLDGAMDG